MTKLAAISRFAVGAVSQAQRERLAYIEMRAWFVGEVRRPDIEARFGVKPAAASRDLTAYRDMAPRNLEYDSAARCYRPSSAFKPVFGFSVDRVLSWLQTGFGDGLDPRPKKPAPCEGPGGMGQPHLDVLAAVSRAICAGRVLRISYLSVSSGRSARIVVPVALADTGVRWHVRAFDRRNRRFSDFALRRIEKAEILDERASEGETLDCDEQWTRIVDLELAPHPRAKWPEGIVADYGMEGGILRTRIRAALAGYFLHRWQVDCTPDHRMDPVEHHLWLKNPETLYGVDSAALAPGRGDAVAERIN
ncbi:MAG: WYL domain-containing protein [Vicinamibacteria bacterium]|nr:WYL domain-containing protein [Vicinamibacteria bacterium]